MRLKDLEVFIILSEVGNLHRAAQKTGITQSAVTKIVQRLEAEFETPLLRRGGRGVELTEAGWILKERAQAVGASVSETYAEMAAAKSASVSRIRIGTVYALMESALIPIVSRFLEQEDKARFSLTAQVSSILIEEVIAGSIDFALCFSDDQIPPELQSDDLGRQRYSIVAREGHGLSSTKGDFESLATARWLLPYDGHGMRKMVEKYFKDHQLGSPCIIVETDVSTSQLSSLIKKTDLVTMMTDTMLAHAAGYGLTTLPFADAYLESGLRLFYRRNMYLPPLMQRLREQIQTAMHCR